MDSLIYLIPLFFLTALTYSTAGLGGGSMYLALLALFSYPYQQIPQIALMCNLLVVSQGFYLFSRAGYFSLKRVLPFILSSIPLAYLGGRIPIGKNLFGILLGLSLLAAALRLLIHRRAEDKNLSISWTQAFAVGIPLGAVLGFLSGLVGIGGGIFLGPFLLLIKWADSKQAAAVASFFILVNSLAGLVGQVQKEGWVLIDQGILFLGLAVLLGGQLGARMGSQWISKPTLQRVTGCLILIVALKLLYQAAFS